jgi:hypothetical protein
MKQFIAIISISLILGCSSNGNSDKKAKITSKGSHKSEYTGSFKATTSDGKNSKAYSVNIRCGNFDEDYFQFFSDKDDITDSNGDGLIISGFQDGEKLNLTIVDHGKSYSSGNITGFTKGHCILTAKGILFKEGTAETINVSFFAKCE